MEAFQLYHHFGLTVSSEWPLPLERTNIGAARADVRIRRGPVVLAGRLAWRSQVGPDCTYYDAGEHHVLDLGMARFAITPGDIVVDADDGATSTQLLLFPVWATLLAMRGRETLHGAVVECDGRGLALFGPPGYGKSTGSLMLLDCGWRLVTDDLITFDDNDRVVPGPPFMRLRDDRAEGRRAERDGAGKHRYAPAVADAPVPLTAAIVLADRFTDLRQLSSTEAVEALLTTPYNVFPSRPLQALTWFQTSVKIARRVPIYGSPPRSLTADQLLTIAQGT